MIKKSNPTGRILLISLICFGAIFISSCQRSKPPDIKHYPFTGRVVSIDSQNQSALIDGDAVPGFMEAMAMAYPLKPPSGLQLLAPGDAISAEIVVARPDAKNPDAAPDYWLENVKITGHTKSPPAVTNATHTPSLGEDVPDFSMIDQDGRKVSLHQYRGKVLLLTFIYTRCPFPDFCPRMSGNFAEIYKQLKANSSLGNVRLLSISFDPAQDTPKVLRNYAFSVAHTHDPKLFSRWEFATPRDADLPKIADFFALTIKPENGLITHNLSTAIIGSDGKIVAWYHGGDWQVSDLMRDTTAALAGN